MTQILRDVTDSCQHAVSRHRQVRVNTTLTRLRGGQLPVRLSSVPTVGENLKRLRLAAGFSTATALSKAVGMTLQRVSELENSRYELPDTRTLIQLANALHCSVDALLEGYVTSPVSAMSETAEQSHIEEKKKLSRVGNERIESRQSEPSSSFPTGTEHGPPSDVTVSTDAAALLDELRANLEKLTGLGSQLAGLGGSLERSLVALNSLSDAVTDRAASFTTAPIDEQAGTARLLTRKSRPARTPGRQATGKTRKSKVGR
jgi:transcriptional regulator with XRE-family HTH domain